MGTKRPQPTGSSQKSADKNYENPLINQAGEHFPSQDSDRLPPEWVTNVTIALSHSAL
jgi:hypothetical protein